MELNDLEAKFFREFLNAELNVPVQATLGYQGISLEMIIVPEITASGYFQLNYYNAPAAKPECDLNGGGVPLTEWRVEEDFGRHPLLYQAWSNDYLVSLHLHSSPMPFQPKVDPSLAAKVIHAGIQHRGRLALDKNQVMKKESQLVKTRFNLVGFPDFLTPERQRDSISGIDDSKRQALRSFAKELTGGATVNVALAPHHVVLECDDEWKITLIRDEKLTRGSVSHVGVIEKGHGDPYNTDEVSEMLRCLKYFFAFAACTYCYPTVSIGYDFHQQPVWGQIGRFALEWRPPTNWFNNINLRMGKVLEQLFPKFWLKWQDHKNEMIAIIECYVHSYAMRDLGITNDAVAKSYTGLNLLSSLQQGKVVSGSTNIKNTLSVYDIPNLTTAVVERIAKRLGSRKRQGPDLLDRVRGYTAHPLEGGMSVKVKQEPLKYLDSEPRDYVYLHDLSQFYLEYTFLAYCGLRFADHRTLLEDIQ